MMAQVFSFFGVSLIVFLVAWMISILNNANNGRRPGNNNSGRRNHRPFNATSQSGIKVAFLHPNCWDGGGGERTLWAAVVALKKKCPQWKVSILAASLPDESKIKRVQNDFGLNVLFEEIEFIQLRLYGAAESWLYPRLTLLGQALGSFLVAVEVAFKSRDASLIVDTIGYPFVYPLLKGVFGFKVLAYVHYPFINYDVLKKPSFKYAYNWILLRAYSTVGAFVDAALCNSSWTFGHIASLWLKCRQRSIIYPPCDLKEFLSLEHEDTKADGDEFVILSLSQFRPEKNHRLQLEIAQIVCKQLPQAKFVFVGGCRNAHDQERVNLLKSYASELGISSSVHFSVNLPFPELMKQLSRAHVGLHTMFEEHFGIGIVELMGAGLITIAHNSGGPRADIIRPGKNGYLCSSAQEYAQAILKVAAMSIKERQSIIDYARADVKKRFSGDLFEESIVRVIKQLV